jgi:hypothetical protein
MEIISPRMRAADHIGLRAMGGESNVLLSGIVQCQGRKTAAGNEAKMLA